MSMNTPRQDRNLWDYIKSGISGVSQGVGSAVNTAVEIAPGSDLIRAAGRGIGAVGSFVGRQAVKPFEALGRLEGETLKGNALRQNISQLILPNEIGGYTATKAEREKASQRIGMGRALYFRIEDTLDHVLGRNIGSKIMPDSYDPKTGQLYNVYKEGKSQKYYSQLGVSGNLITGSFDLVAGSMASPFIILGGFGKLAKGQTLEKSITTERVVKDLDVLQKAEQDRFSYLSADARLKEVEAEDITITGRTAQEVIDERTALQSAIPDLKAKADKAVEDLSKIEYADGFDEFIRQATVLNAEQLIKHRVVKESSDPELLAGLLGETKDVYEAALIVRASAGDINAQRLLAAESTSTYMALQNARKPLGELTDEIKASKQTDGDLSAFGLLPENAEVLSDEFADLIKRDAFLERAVQAADQKVLEGRIGTSVFSSVEAFRASKAQTFSEIGLGSNKLWDVEYFRRNPFVSTVAVVTWPFRERPSGWVRTKGINSTDSSKELEAFMANTKAWSDDAGMAKKQQYMRQYLSATDEIARENIVRRIENDAIKSTAEKYGLSPKEAQEIADRLDRDRGSTVKFYKERGFLLDHNNQKVYAPQLKTQLADSVPMIDIRQLDNLLGKQAGVWKQSFIATKDMTLKPLDLLDELWRPAVLMRLGYTQRNVFEGWGRATARLGYMTALGSAKALVKVSKVGDKYNVDGTFANFFRNRHAGLLNAISVRKGVLDAANLKRANKGLPKTKMPPLKASWNQVISLQEDAIVMNRLHMTRLQEELKDLGTDPTTLTQRNAIINELAKRRIFEKDANTQLRSYVNQSTKKGIKGNRYRTGQGFISYGNYDNLPKIYEGDFGDVLMELAGSQSRVKLELTSSGRVYSGLDNAQYRNAGFTRLEPTDPNYYVGLERVVNRQFRNSPVMMMVLRGDNPNDILKYLNTKQGRREMRAVRKNDPETYTLELLDVAQRYIPDATLRKRIANEELSAAELRLALKDRSDLRPIHGDKIEELPDLRVLEKYQKGVREIFRFIGALPEDVFVRHPFANAIYTQALKNSIDNANRQGIKLTNNEMEGIIAGARRKALQETRRTLYTIERYSNLAHVVRFLEPFFMAAQNTAQVWSKLAYRDPRLFGYAGYIYMAPDRAGAVQTDPLTDREVITMQIPDWMRKGKLKTWLRDVDNVTFEKGSLNLIVQGQDWWRIGDGPFSQVFASEFAKQYPTTPFRPLLDYVLPRGGSRAFLSYDLFAPTVLKRILDSVQEVDSRDYANSLAIITQVENNRYRRGERDEPTNLEIKQRADAFAFLRGLGAFTLPVSLRYRTEMQFYIDKARLYREKFGPDAALRFYQDHPDYFEFFFSISRNPTGMDPTQDAIKNLKKYQGLVDQVTNPKTGAPEFLQLITNAYGTPTEFDQISYNWQFLNAYRTGGKEKIRTPQSADEIVVANELQRGWIEYNKFMNRLDRMLAQIPGDNITYQSSEARNLVELKRLWVDEQKRNNPAWFKAYNDPGSNIKGYHFVLNVKKILKDKKFMADRGQEPVWDALNEYVKNRDEMVQILKARDLAGGSANIRAKSNEGLANTWALLVQEIKTLDPTGTFTNYYNRFLENDTFEEIIND